MRPFLVIVGAMVLGSAAHASYYEACDVVGAVSAVEIGERSVDSRKYTFDITIVSVQTSAQSHDECRLSVGATAHVEIRSWEGERVRKLAEARLKQMEKIKSKIGKKKAPTIELLYHFEDDGEHSSQGWSFARK